MHDLVLGPDVAQPYRVAELVEQQADQAGAVDHATAQPSRAGTRRGVVQAMTRP